MGLRVGIVGLPNVGKSTLFNSLLKKRVALSANYPFATIEPNTGIVAVPDERLLKLAEITKVEEKMDSLPPLVNATVEFVDIAGLVKGASEGAGLGNKFLSHIREVDAIIHVLRDFEDSNIVREGSVDALSDRETIETELALADMQVMEKLIAGQEKLARTNGSDPIEKQKMEILNSINTTLSEGRMLGKYEVGDERLKLWFETLPLLTTKPVLYVFNVDEGSYAGKLEQVVNDNEIYISAKIEEELVELSDEDKNEYLAELGIKEPGLERLIKKAYSLLGLASFLTAGKKEVKAWTFKTGMKAPETAGVIHTDFIKKFIRAQVVSYDQLMEAGSMAIAKSKGWVRTEGKEYVMKDGDVVEFLIGS
jgi:GTP-binding protein YchF